MILQLLKGHMLIGCAPRIRGDDPNNQGWIRKAKLCSPHPRG